jgi:hypothetical protein
MRVLPSQFNFQSIPQVRLSFTQTWGDEKEIEGGKREVGRRFMALRAEADSGGTLWF